MKKINLGGEAIFNLIERVFARAIELDPKAAARLRALQGKIIAIELLRDTQEPVVLYLSPTENSLRVSYTCERPADVHLQSTIAVFLRLLLHRNEGVRVGEMQVQGDVALGQEFQAIMKELEPDWEEGLAQRIGDVPAYQIGRFIRAGRSWAKQTAKNLQRDVRDYLQEESDLLARPERVQAFLRAVDDLRDDAERLSIQIQTIKADVNGRAR